MGVREETMKAVLEVTYIGKPVCQITIYASTFEELAESLDFINKITVEKHLQTKSKGVTVIPNEKGGFRTV
jgi:hypothetical protein